MYYYFTSEQEVLVCGKKREVPEWTDGILLPALGARHYGRHSINPNQQWNNKIKFYEDFVDSEKAQKTLIQK
jgi:hypothetical protein